MKKKTSFLIISMIFALLLCASCDACSSGSVTFVAKKPWDDMPRLYERSEYKIVEYSMKVEDGVSIDDVKLSEGKLVFTLSDGPEGYAVLEMETEITYLDIEKNGADRGLTDKYFSRVVFNKITMNPSSSVKTVTLADRAGKGSDSFSLDIDYANGKEKLTFRGETKERETGVSGQVFDNEQLFFLVRSLSALTLSGTQSFGMHVGLDAFNYDISSYAMKMTVNSALQTVKLNNWKGESAYGLELEGGVPVVECFTVSLGINSDKSGSPITATYSAKPFAITQNITADKILTGFTTSSYEGENYEDARTTYYTLIDYDALAAKE